MAEIDEPLHVSPGDCIGWYMGGSTGIVPYDIASNVEGSPGVLWFHGHRVARLGSGDGFTVSAGETPTNIGELSMANGWAQRVYSVRVRRRPLPSAPAMLPGNAISRLGVIDFADAWLLTGEGAIASGDPCGASSDLEVVGCTISEAGFPNATVDEIVWSDVLSDLCSCTNGQGVVGGAAATVGACCNLDTLDKALRVAGNPSGIVCLHGLLALLAACTAKLALRRPLWPFGAMLASANLRAKLKKPGHTHMMTPIQVVDAPTAPSLWPKSPTGGFWDFVIEPTDNGRSEGATHTYRLRGNHLGGTFAPFPFGSQDLLWWRAPTEEEVMGLLSEVLIGLHFSGVKALAFAGTLRRLSVGPHAGMPDVLVPLASRQAVRQFVLSWVESETRSPRYAADLPRRIELGILPDAPSMRGLWPEGVGFDVVCPQCARVTVHFYVRGAASLSGKPPTIITTERIVASSSEGGGEGGGRCVWPESAVLPLKWLPVSDVVSKAALSQPTAMTNGPLNSLLTQELPDLPCPADSARVLRQLGDGPKEAVGPCWPELAAAASEAAADASRRGSEPSFRLADLGLASLSDLAPEFDLSADLRPGMGFYDLFDLRQRATSAALTPLVDKVALKERLHRQGLPFLRQLYATYESPNVRGVLSGLTRYAMKAAHMHHGGMSVLLVDRGVDLLTGKQIGVDEVQARAEAMWAVDFETEKRRCVSADGVNSRGAKGGSESGGGMQCITNAPRADEALVPAVLIEELAVTWDGRTGVVADEAFCFVSWGRMVLCGVMNAGGVWGGYLTRNGAPVYINSMKAQSGVRNLSGAAFRPPVPWPFELFEQVVILAERTALALSADFIRVDVFPNGGSPVISEVSIVSGWFGRANLKWGEVDSWLLELLGERWLEGYALANGHLGPRSSISV
eukprot:TRINITY_DN74068_c0_g1_i1.p1 TRINITY_DN74068_c0_g1~~TRINITY_DN74068_c0_g1_i1.p1  ORF type:complete len:1063 (-),score=160.69 TRINITY_DN74068_c0_g1_i1:95-2824(-)